MPRLPIPITAALALAAAGAAAQPSASPAAAGQPGTIRTANFHRIRSDSRGQLDAGLAPITQRLGAAPATVHVLHFAGAQELEERILTADRGELIVDDTRVRGDLLSSTTREGRQLAASARSADDILSSLAAENGAFTSPAPRGSGSRSIASRPGTNAGTD